MDGYHSFGKCPGCKYHRLLRRGFCYACGQKWHVGSAEEYAELKKNMIKAKKIKAVA